MKTHQLKTYPEHFKQILNGSKTFEVRLNDRDFKIGDRLLLMEWSRTKENYTGRHCLREITYIMRDGNEFLPLGDMVIMAIK